MNRPTAKELQDSSIERLNRKLDQHNHMASLAFRDGDLKDGQRHVDIAKVYIEEIKSRG